MCKALLLKWMEEVSALFAFFLSNMLFLFFGEDCAFSGNVLLKVLFFLCNINLI